MQHRWTIVGLGEALFDVFDEESRLGGAPLNAAVQVHNLLGARGGKAIVVSRVGQDELGDRLRAELAERRMDDGYVQTDPDHPTGRVYVTQDDKGNTGYDIVQDVAWDWLQFDPDVEDLAHRCDAVCFGTLAQRHGQSRSTIQRFLNEAKRASRLLDINLRPPDTDRQIICRSLDLATAVKLSDDELRTVTQMLGLPLSGDDGDMATAARKLIDQFDLNYVAVTRGERGTVLITKDEELEGTSPSQNTVPSTNSIFGGRGDGDVVGAGDAVCATLMAGELLRLPWQQTIDAANAIGAYVATQPGATPKLPDGLRDLLFH